MHNGLRSFDNLKPYTVSSFYVQSVKWSISPHKYIKHMNNHTTFLRPGGLCLAALSVVFGFLALTSAGCYKVEEKTVIQQTPPTVSGTEGYTKVVNDYSVPEDSNRSQEGYWDADANGIIAATSSDGLWKAVARISSGNDAEFDLVGPNGINVLVRHAQPFEFSPDSSFLTYQAYIEPAPGNYCNAMLRKIDLDTLEDVQISHKGVDCTSSEDEKNNPNSLPWMGVAKSWQGHVATYILQEKSVTINFDTGEIVRSK